MTPVAFGWSVLVLAVLLAIGHAGIWLDRRGLRADLERKENALRVWQVRTRAAERECETLREQIDDRDADNITLAHKVTAQRNELQAMEAQLKRFDRKHGANGRFTGRVK